MSKRVGSDRIAQLSQVAAEFGSFRPASEVLTDVRAVPTRFVQLDLATRVGGWPIERFTMIHGPSNHGKAQPVDEVVLTPMGWVPIGELEVGDLVIGSGGQHVAVTGVFPQGKKRVVAVVADDGSSARCCVDHLWYTTTVNELNRGRYERGPRPERARVPTGQEGTGSAKTALRIAESLDEVHYLPRPLAVMFDDPGGRLLDPYYLGLLLGDGSFVGTSLTFTSEDEDQLECVREHAESMGDAGVRYSSVNRCPGVRVTGGPRGHSAGSATKHALVAMGLWGKRSENKHVPLSYLRAPATERLALLQGLMDTDGAVSNEGTQAQFSTTSLALRDAVVDLIRSLGGRAFTYRKETPCLPAWCVMVSFSGDVCPFRTVRKAGRWVIREKEFRQRIVAVEPLGEAECVCISVSAEDHLYVTRDYMVTHNTLCLAGLMESFLSLDHFAVYLDAERTSPIRWFRTLMGPRADHPAFFAQRPDTYEGVMADVRNFCNLMIQKKKDGDLEPDVSALFGVDSLRKLVPRDMMKEILEAEKMSKAGDIKGGKDRSAQVKARMNAAWMDEVVPLLEKAGAGMVVIGREMKDPDADPRARMWGTDYKVGGGEAVYYDSSLVVRVERAGYVQHGKEGEKKKVYGERHRMTIKKTKVGGKEDKSAVAYFHSSNGTLTPEGFDRGRDVMELAERFGILELRGSTYSYDGQRLGKGGQHNAAVHLADNPEVCAAMEVDVRARFAEQKPIEVDEETGEIT